MAIFGCFGSGPSRIGVFSSLFPLHTLCPTSFWLKRWDNETDEVFSVYGDRNVNPSSNLIKTQTQTRIVIFLIWWLFFDLTGHSVKAAAWTQLFGQSILRSSRCFCFNTFFPRHGIPSWEKRSLTYKFKTKNNKAALAKFFTCPFKRKQLKKSAYLSC